MAETVITIVGHNFDSAAEPRAAQRVREAGVDGLQLDRLHPGRAIDILLAERSSELTALLRRKLASLGGFDVFIQPNDRFRKKKLLIADMDATIVRQETLDELAAHFNLRDKIAPITEKAMRGEIDFQEALRMRVRLLKGLPLEALFEPISRAYYSPGAATLVKAMRCRRVKCVLVSGGFDLFTNHVAATLGFNESFGNQLEIEEQKLTGEVIPPIIDKYVKEQLVVKQAQALGCELQYVVAVGDGANDVPMLKKAG